MDKINKGRVSAICICAERGRLKKEVASARFIQNSGIEGDGHSGDWGRQVTCLSLQSVQKSNEEHGKNMGPGDFAENLLIDGLDFSNISAGCILKLGGSVELEVTQIGKEDHPSVVTRTFGVSLLPSEGLFCRVLRGGTLKTGDEVVQIL